MRLRGHELAWERSNSDKKRAGTRGSPATGRSNGCWSDIRKRNKHSLICHLCIPKNRNSYFHIIFMKYWNLIKYNIWWLHRCWWRIMETECVGDKFEMLVTDLIYRKNHHYSEKSGQHNDSANNISNRSPSWSHQHNDVTNINVTFQNCRISVEIFCCIEMKISDENFWKNKISKLKLSDEICWIESEISDENNWKTCFQAFWWKFYCIKMCHCWPKHLVWPQIRSLIC